jgi:hypothetical protein
MINFRYHVVSLIAVFLALAIGVIMGSAVIDRAIVDRLEDQQRGLEDDVDEVQAENSALRRELGDLQETSEQLAVEGGQRLLAGTLTDVPVLVLAVRGSESDTFDALLSMLDTSGADRLGTVWLTDRFALDDDDEVRDLAAALGADDESSAQALRALALARLSNALRRAAGPAVTPIDDPSVAPTSTTATTLQTDAPDLSVLTALRDAGFIDFQAVEGAPDDVIPVSPGTRLLVVSGPAAAVPAGDLAVPLIEQLLVERSALPNVALLAAEERARPDAPGATFVELVRAQDDLAGRLSTVDNLGDFAGRLAVVLAVADLDEGRVGHYGRFAGSQRLLPAPPEDEG